MDSSNASGSMTTAGMGEVKVVRRTGSIGCIGLGSCVGVLVFDPTLRAAALAHVMLPDDMPTGAPMAGKYAVSAVPALLRVFGGQQGAKGRLVAALVGGAELFRSREDRPGLRIGVRNVERLTALLEAAAVPIVASAIGGATGRSFEFDVESGQLRVRTPGSEVQTFCLAPEMLRQAA